MRFRHHNINALGVALLALFAHALTGTAAVAMRYLVGIFEAQEIACVRYFIGSLFVFCLLLIFKTEKTTQPYLLKSIVLGMLFFGLFPYTFALSFHYIGAAKGALIIATMPAWSMLIAAVLRIERVHSNTLIAIAITLIGLAIALIDKWTLNEREATYYFGELLMLTTAAIGGLYSVLAQVHMQHIPVLRFTPVMMMAGFMVLLPWTLDGAFIEKLIHMETRELSIILYVGVFTGGLAFYVFNWLIEKTSASYATLFVPMSPLTAMLIAPFLLHETISINYYFGALIVFAGLVMGHKSMRTPQN